MKLQRHLTRRAALTTIHPWPGRPEAITLLTVFDALRMFSSTSLNRLRNSIGDTFIGEAGMFTRARIRRGRRRRRLREDRRSLHLPVPFGQILGGLRRALLRINGQLWQGRDGLCNAVRTLPRARVETLERLLLENWLRVPARRALLDHDGIGHHALRSRWHVRLAALIRRRHPRPIIHVLVLLHSDIPALRSSEFRCHGGIHALQTARLSPREGRADLMRRLQLIEGWAAIPAALLEHSGGDVVRIGAERACHRPGVRV